MGVFPTGTFTPKIDVLTTSLQVGRQKRKADREEGDSTLSFSHEIRRSTDHHPVGRAIIEGGGTRYNSRGGYAGIGTFP